MHYLTPVVWPFLWSLTLGLALTPIMWCIARRWSLVDRPSPRKFHATATPLLGGVAIYLAFVGGRLLAGPLDDSTRAIFGGATLLLLLGLADDLQGMRPATKLLGQILAAVLVVVPGVGITVLGSPWLNVPATILWIVAITNAVNLLDNMDGLSAGVAFIAAAAFGVLAARYIDAGPDQRPTALLSATLAGGCLAFLPYNLRGGRIFMGDAGSLVVGFVLAAVAALGNWRSPAVATSILIPLLVLAYPIFDTLLVIILRRRRGQPISRGGTDHSSHRLVSLGLGRTETVLLIYLFSLCHALTAALVSSVTLNLSLIALGVSASVLFIFGMVLRKAKV